MSEVAAPQSSAAPLARFGAAFGNGYALLPERAYSRIAPSPVSQPRLIKINRALACELGLDLEDLDADTLAQIFSGNRLIPGSQPLAMAYAGHQFGNFVPRLGDGRAILLGDVLDRDGRRREIQLKGSGRTPYSRGGDGRAAVGPVLREYLVSEAMHALGIAATRALAAVTTGELVFRDEPLPGAIVTRVATSHVRVGTFQYFAARGDHDATLRLIEFVIARHYPHLAAADNRALELLRAVVRRQAALVASWMQLGFVHGVMNTDNMSVSGETIDFGPCAFMDVYDPATVFSSIDHGGRYAYANQPAAAQWNLARFAETLLSHIDADGERAIELATAVVAEFAAVCDAHWLAAMRRKLGLFREEDIDASLVQRFLDILKDNGADYTRSFRHLCASAESREADANLHGSFADAAACREWLAAWRARALREPQSASEHAACMRLVNPAVIPRNHRVEQAIQAALASGDYGPFERLNSALSRPYEARPEFAEFERAPRPDERVLQTFCGT